MIIDIDKKQIELLKSYKYCTVVTRFDERLIASTKFTKNRVDIDKVLFNGEWHDIETMEYESVPDFEWYSVEDYRTTE